MDREFVSPYLNKYVRIVLKNPHDYSYEGRIITLGSTGVQFQDRYHLIVAIEFDNISAILPMRGGEEW